METTQTYADKIDALLLDDINKLKEELYKQIDQYTIEEEKLHKELDELNEKIKKDIDEDDKTNIKERINELNIKIAEVNNNYNKISKLTLEDLIKIKENSEVKLEI